MKIILTMVATFALYGVAFAQDSDGNRSMGMSPHNNMGHHDNDRHDLRKDGHVKKTYPAHARMCHRRHCAR
jgi:hypothetical protein